MHRAGHLPRPYRTPFVPAVPLLGILVCFAMMHSLDVETWYRLFAWLAIGLVIYVGYSRVHSRRQQQVAMAGEKARAG